MTQDLTFEIDHGMRFGAGLVVALAILLLPLLAKGGLLPVDLSSGSTAYWAWVLVGGPAAFLLAQKDVYAVRRVRLVVSPARDEWVLERASLGNASRAAGSLRDLARADYEERRPHHVAVRLVGRDGQELAEVLGFGDKLGANPLARVALGGEMRPFRPGESVCDVAMVLHGRLLDILDARPGAVARRA